MSESFWRRCSTCKREIRFDVPYWACSVTTCNRQGNAFVFCMVSCWDAHVPTMRHREAWAEERRSPRREDWESARSQPPAREPAPAPAPAAAAQPSPAAAAAPAEIPREILIIASRLKQYVRACSGMNTSESVMEVLSRRVRALCDDAILRAQEDGRKTLMDRDF
jgi:hypothetical protein